MHPRRDSLWRHLWLGIVVLALLAFIEGSGLIRLGRSGIRPDLVLSAVITWSFLTNSTNGALWGFIGGLMLDGISAGPFPLHAVALTLVGGLIGTGRLSYYADEQAWAVIAGVAGIAVFYSVTLLILWLTGWGLPLLQALRVLVLPSLVVDAIGVLIMLPVLRAVNRRLFSARGKASFA